MKKLLLAALLIGVSLHNPLSASPLKKISAKSLRKKSKESAILKAITGSIIFCIQGAQFLANLNSKSRSTSFSFRIFFKQNALLPLLPLFIGVIIAKHGFDDLNEIAQKE